MRASNGTGNNLVGLFADINALNRFAVNHHLAQRARAQIENAAQHVAVIFFHVTFMVVQLNRAANRLGG